MIQGRQNQAFELLKTSVYPRSSLSFQQWFSRLLKGNSSNKYVKRGNTRKAN